MTSNNPLVNARNQENALVGNLRQQTVALNARTGALAPAITFMDGVGAASAAALAELTAAQKEMQAAGAEFVRASQHAAARLARVQALAAEAAQAASMFTADIASAVADLFAAPAPLAELPSGCDLSIPAPAEPVVLALPATTGQAAEIKVATAACPVVGTEGSASGTTGENRPIVLPIATTPQTRAQTARKRGSAKRV